MAEADQASVERALLRGQTLLLEAVEGLEEQRSLAQRQQAALRLPLIAAQEQISTLDQRLSQIVSGLAGGGAVDSNRLEGELMGALLILAEAQRCLVQLDQAIENPQPDEAVRELVPAASEVGSRTSSSSLVTPARLEAELRRLREQLFALSVSQERSSR